MRKTKEIKIGHITIGNNHPVIIQSMTNTKTKDIQSTVEQIHALDKLGAQIVRVSVVDEEDAIAITEIKKYINLPIVADIHFSYKLAIKAIEAGADKIRINPGNIGNIDEIKKIVEKCKEKNIPIRVGINSGSLEKNLYEKYHGVTAEALLESMEKYILLLESFNFYNIVLSIKATDLQTTIEANRLLAKRFTYPIHIGLTEAGTVNSGTIRSSYVLGTLLNEGIGNTIRISVNGAPEKEIPIVKELLKDCKLIKNVPNLIACPTCGRTQWDMEPVVNEIESYLQTIHKEVTVAIMGCAVNGPGEAKHADIAIAGGKKEGLLIKKGKIIEKIPQDQIVARLKEEIDKF